MAASRAIQDRLSLYGGGWKRLSIAFWNAPDLRWRYPEAMKASYHAIRASVPLLESALAEARARGPEDAVAAGLARYLAHHIEEERGHDGWLAEDLARLGVSGEALAEEIPSPAVAAMVGAQHYWVRHAHPVSILGYLAVLEGEPPEESLLTEAAARAGLPEAALSTLRYHARVDKAHWQDLLDLFDALPLTPRHLALLGLSVLSACQGQEALLRHVLSLQAPAA
jgi:pyrroloquinoline quinone (PQQ) biosynthesis protein C